MYRVQVMEIDVMQGLVKTLKGIIVIVGLLYLSYSGIKKLTKVKEKDIR